MAQCHIESKTEKENALVTAKTGLDALLTPERSVLLLIDHQAFQFSSLHSHEPTPIVDSVVGLAKAAKAFKVPTILTTDVVCRLGVKKVLPKPLRVRNCYPR